MFIYKRILDNLTSAISTFPRVFLLSLPLFIPWVTILICSVHPHINVVFSFREPRAGVLSNILEPASSLNISKGIQRELVTVELKCRRFKGSVVENLQGGMWLTRIEFRYFSLQCSHWLKYLGVDHYRVNSLTIRNSLVKQNLIRNSIFTVSI